MSYGTRRGREWEPVSVESIYELKEALDAYDDANEIEGDYKKRFENLHQASERLAEVVRNVVEDEEPEEEMSTSAGYQGGWSNHRTQWGGSKSTLSVGLSIHETVPVKIDDVVYPTAMNAFQAHKASPANRGAYTTLTWPDAVARGRTETIDIVAWDKNREPLMTSILVAQARQNDTMRDIVMEHAGTDLFENSMSDAFWPTVLPTIWKNVKAALDGTAAPSSDPSSSKKRKKHAVDQVEDEAQQRA